MWVSFYKNKGDKFNPKNYRPITIASCFEKLFTAVLQMINNFIKISNLLSSSSEIEFSPGTFACKKKSSKSCKNKENRKLIRQR
jgi:hypothetical protein